MMTDGSSHLEFPNVSVNNGDDQVLNRSGAVDESQEGLKLAIERRGNRNVHTVHCGGFTPAILANRIHVHAVGG